MTRRSIEKPNRYFTFLRGLRAGGRTNMYGAIPYLASSFGCTREEAFQIVCEWIDSQAVAPVSAAPPAASPVPSRGRERTSREPSLFDAPAVESKRQVTSPKKPRRGKKSPRHRGRLSVHRVRASGHLEWTRRANDTSYQRLTIWHDPRKRPTCTAVHVGSLSHRRGSYAIIHHCRRGGLRSPARRRTNPRPGGALGHRCALRG